MQLKQLFGFCGSVEDVRFSGDPERFAIIEYGAPGVSSLASPKLSSMINAFRPWQTSSSPVLMCACWLHYHEHPACTLLRQQSWYVLKCSSCSRGLQRFAAAQCF